jgi:hypothetical protein
MAWIRDETLAEDRDRIIGVGCGDGVHTIGYGWLEAMAKSRLFAYRLPADRFRAGRHRVPRRQAFGSPEPHAHVAIEQRKPIQ